MTLYTATFASPLGEMLIAGADKELTGVWFVGQKYFPAEADHWTPAPEIPVLAAAVAWLETYFAGEDPGEVPPLRVQGSVFQERVWRVLAGLRRGELITYGEIARRLAAETGVNVSAQAVGGAVGRNRLSIMIPCHRVVGADGSLTGYAGGIEKKIALLNREGVDVAAGLRTALLQQAISSPA